MKLIKEYKIYELDSQHLKGSDSYSRGKEQRVCLVETRFKGYESNSFETIELAFEYLVTNNMLYTDYTVLLVVRVLED
jgi:hypothetical protein